MYEYAHEDREELTLTDFQEYALEWIYDSILDPSTMDIAERHPFLSDEQIDRVLDLIENAEVSVRWC